MAVGALTAWLVVALASSGARRLADKVDSAILRAFAEVRTPWLTSLLRPVDRVTAGWGLSVVAFGLLGLLIIFRRWRHLFTFIGAVLILEIVGQSLFHAYARHRPYDVAIIGRWVGYSMPAAAVAVTTIIGVGVVYGLVVPGRPRTIAKTIAIAFLGLVVLTRLYLGADHPSDVLVSGVFAVAIAVNAFRFFTPNEVFPVAYRRGKTAHLDIGGRRGEAVKRAVEDQLGLTVLDIKPVGLAGSGGSTPLRLCIAGEPDTYLFGKLYAMNHVRADRWYKLGRTILYGRLEDETPFQSVRRLVQYEDYALRLLRDLGIPTATPYGIVELTPEREYLLVTEFFDGAQEMGDAVVDEQLIDQGLALIRSFWDGGVAHRDIKPANLMVRDGQLLLIDVAFVQIRPSPWREAVDLANMMLTLACRTDAEMVYRRALNYFTPDEIAEAFAAARGIASPTQLRTAMKRDGRNLLAQFRKLVPERRPISLQRWSPRRILLALGLFGGAALAFIATFDMFTPAELQATGTPSCGTGDLMILMAQAFPQATSVPCVASLPAGWRMGSLDIRRGRAAFWLDSDRAGQHAIKATLHPPGDCVVTDAIEVPSDEVGTRRFERPEQLRPRLRATRYYVFNGGCVTYQFDFRIEADGVLLFAIDNALGFQPRDALVDAVKAEAGLRLCGASAPRCPGES